MVFFFLSKSLSSFESNTFIFSIPGQTYTNILPLLCVPHSKLVASGNRQRHTGTAALLGSAGMQRALPALRSPLPRQAAAHLNPPLPCPALSAAICPSPGDGGIPFLAPRKRRLSGKVEQSSAVTHVPAATGEREPGTSRAGGTGERSGHSGCSGRVPPLPPRDSSRRVSPLPHRGSSRRVPPLPAPGFIPARLVSPSPGLIPGSLASPSPGLASPAPGFIPAGSASRTPRSSNRSELPQQSGKGEKLHSLQAPFPKDLTILQFFEVLCGYFTAPIPNN